MENRYEFFIAGRTRNQDEILKICDLFDKYKITYYCFLKNEGTMNSYGNEAQSVEEKQQEFESLGLKSPEVLRIFREDYESEMAAEKFLLVLPAGNSGHIEAGIAYGKGKKCYAVGKYEATDSLYNIFEEIFADRDELEQFLKVKRRVLRRDKNGNRQ